MSISILFFLFFVILILNKLNSKIGDFRFYIDFQCFMIFKPSFYHIIFISIYIYYAKL